MRMHYTYTNTDGPANIVPSYAATNYFIRSGKWERTEDASKRVDDCARGAALMTGTRVEIERVTCNKEMKVNRVLAETFYEEMKKIPVPVYTEDELDFAAEITKNAGLGTGDPADLFGGLEPLEDEPVPLAIGTDVSDVSHTVPTVMLSAACMCKGTPLHHLSLIHIFFDADHSILCKENNSAEETGVNGFVYKCHLPVFHSHVKQTFHFRQGILFNLFCDMAVA